MAINYSPNIVTNGLVLCLDARNSKSYPGSGTTWTDISSGGNNGTLVNTPTYNSAGYINFAYASSESVSFASAANLQFLNTANYTLEAWVYPTRNPGAANYTGIINREDSSVGAVRDGYNIYFLGSATSSTSFVTERFSAGTNANASYTLDSSLSVNVWQHIVAVYNGSTLTLYRNGVQVGTIATGVTGNLTNNVKTLDIGVRGGQYFDGNIANVKIYSVALSATQVAQNFNAHRGRFGI